MVDQNLLTIFVSVTTLAILIQTGMVAGICYMTLQITNQANRATAEAQKFQQPLGRLADSLVSASNRVAAFSSSSRGQIHQFEVKLDRTLDRARRKI